ncbi:ABC transporter substrate-binding protein [Gemmobacter fulvus]|uniref:ABC transporter substrate-binding protein n=1 Tax=Gemmobacter fulvus TaxID=2840474 RepID=A0A975P5F6_9RHOB|nr:ABC transporter substrate-binding protein [Gemmobacter fulvus]MBT9245702.1 ABC transporter substrate-binding protein [Gemmobacter fulvus]MDQ1847084.1 ABC transporter substrate-binding protein [Gemmobacter fulvus]QWK89448.1 ABC transporter substrate-binding protein [Gemmobacter fulvus]
MLLDPSLRRAGLAALSALMLSTAPAVLLAETPPDTLVIADAIDDIVSLDPHEAYEFSGLDVVNNVYDGLVELDPAKPGEPIPGLAESWAVAEDGMTFTFKMKPGLTFSSGNPVTAEDAAFSLQRAVKLNKSPAFILNQFGWTAENVDSMVTAEGDTLTLKTDKVYAPTFLYNCLTAGVASIVDKATVMANEANGDMGNEWLKNNSAGTGAFVLKSFKPNDGYLLEARAGHWRGDAAVKSVFMRHVPEAATQRLLLEKGDIDVARELTPVDIEGMAGNADVKVQADVGGQIFYLAFNQKNENYKNAKFLEAMRWAVDYQGMADTFLKGNMVPHQAFLPKGYLGAMEDLPYSLDIEKAKALLAESGIAAPKVVLDVRNAADRMDMAQSIQNTFGQAGITVELNIGEGAEQLKRYRARQHDGTLQSWGPDYPDPHTNASAFAMNADNSDGASTGGLAYRNAYDPGELHAKTEAAVAEGDAAKRKAMYEEIQKTHRETSPFIVMFQIGYQSAMRSNVEGFYTGGAIDSAAYWLVTK